MKQFVCLVDKTFVNLVNFLAIGKQRVGIEEFFAPKAIRVGVFRRVSANYHRSWSK